MNHLFCFGLGYSASFFAKEMLKENFRASGTCRSQEKIDSFYKDGITPHLFDTDIPLLHEEMLNDVTHLLISIPPQDNIDIVLSYNHIQSLKNLQWIGYLSTTGVYGNHDGEWVDENSQLKGNSERLKSRINIEDNWRAFPQANIFRLSGIYGKGRSYIDDLRNNKGKRIYKENQVFSRIHVEDICNILKSSMMTNKPSTYNCCDDLPAPQHEVVDYAAKLLGVDSPKLINFEDANFSEMALSFWQNNRRVSNNKIKEDLNVQLKYPTYKEGLKGCL